MLTPLLNFIASENRDVQRFAIMCLKELCENKENRKDLFEQTSAPQMLDALFELMNNADPRVRLMAGSTLAELLGESDNKLIMLDAGSLSRMLAFLRSRDLQLRRVAVDCIVHMTKLQDIHPLPIEYCHSVRAEDVLARIVDAFGSETDPRLLLGLLRSLQSLVGLVKHDVKRTKQRLYEFGLLTMLLDQAKRLNGTGQQTADTLELVSQIMRMLSSLTSRSKPRLKTVYETGHDRTVVLLCKSADKKVRRGAVRLLGRLSTLIMWKEDIVSDTELLPLLLSMCKLDDLTVQVTAANILAEIAELPTTRVAMVDAAVLPVLLNLLRLDDSRVHRDVMRTMAALSEATENRELMSLRALNPILSMLWKEDQATQADTVRTLANLAAPAGVISESFESLVQKQEAKHGFNRGTHAGKTQKSELKLGSTRPIFELVGRFGSSFVPPEDSEEEEGEEERDFNQDKEFNGSMKFRGTLEQALADRSTFEASFKDLLIQQCAAVGATISGDDVIVTGLAAGSDDGNDSASRCSSAPSATSSAEVQPCAVELVVAAAEDARARATAAAAAARKERLPARAANNHPSWWRTEEGKELMNNFNHSSLDRIHLRLVETATFPDLFNPKLPYARCDTYLLQSSVAGRCSHSRH